jgi:hypothetical protein
MPYLALAPTVTAPPASPLSAAAVDWDVEVLLGEEDDDEDRPAGGTGTAFLFAAGAAAKQLIA